ncbi:hypothetical protein FISHEDRAFT_71061 [Fistulina hepatica ATCC 64428]|nr:hypothetical protein FISHEDRAFT_71061 [Fistulina hepatica ATCC 64428]
MSSSTAAVFASVSCTPLNKAIAFLVAPLTPRYPRNAIIKLQLVLQGILFPLFTASAETNTIRDENDHTLDESGHDALTTTTDARALALAISPDELPPRSLLVASLAAAIPWDAWCAALGGGDFVLHITDTYVAVEVGREWVVLWEGDVDCASVTPNTIPTPKKMPSSKKASIDDTDDTPHVPISRHATRVSTSSLAMFAFDHSPEATSPIRLPTVSPIPASPSFADDMYIHREEDMCGERPSSRASTHSVHSATSLNSATSASSSGSSLFSVHSRASSASSAASVTSASCPAEFLATAESPVLAENAESMPIVYPTPAKTVYVYQGGRTNVLSGGVKLGAVSTKSSAVKTTLSKSAKTSSAKPTSSKSEKKAKKAPLPVSTCRNAAAPRFSCKAPRFVAASYASIAAPSYASAASLKPSYTKTASSSYASVVSQSPTTAAATSRVLRNPRGPGACAPWRAVRA